MSDAYQGYAPPKPVDPEMARTQYTDHVYHHARPVVNEAPVVGDGGYKRAPDKIACPNCGENIPQPAGYHINAAGDLCVIDPKKARMAGKISKERAHELELERVAKTKKS